MCKRSENILFFKYLNKTIFRELLTCEVTYSFCLKNIIRIRNNLYKYNLNDDYLKLILAKMLNE